MRLMKSLILVTTVAAFFGCTTTRHELSTRGENLELKKLNRNEYEVIGTVEGVGSDEGTVVLGFFRVGAPTEYYNGVQNQAGQANILGVIFGAAENQIVANAKAKARWELLNKATNADAIIITSNKVDRTEDDFFVFSKNKVTASIKGIAIRYKTDSDLGSGYVPPASKD